MISEKKIPLFKPKFRNECLRISNLSILLIFQQILVRKFLIMGFMSRFFFNFG